LTADNNFYNGDGTNSGKVNYYNPIGDASEDERNDKTEA